MDKVIEKKISKKVVFFLGITSVFIIYSLFSFSDSSASSSANLDGKRLTISHVERRKFEEYIPLRATVESSKSIYIDAVEGGRVEAIFLEEGAIVEKGDTILTLSSPRLQLDVIAREAQATEQLNNLHNTQLSLEISTLDLRESLIDIDYRLVTLRRQADNLKVLRSSSAVSEDEYKTLLEDIDYWEQKKVLTAERIRHDDVVRSTREAQLKSSINLLEHNLSVAKSVLGGLEIKAPESGKLTSLNVELGESKAQGANLGIIDELDSFKATAPVSEFYLSKVNVGQTASLNIDGVDYEMRVNKILPEVNNSQFQVELAFDGALPANLKRGQTLNLKLAVSESDNALTLDNGPFFNDTGGAWVFVLSEDRGVATKRRVSFGRRTPSMVEVISGLEPGDRVITSSYRNYIDAESVDINRG